MPLARIQAPQLLLILATLALGLFLDVHTGIAGQALVGAAFWIVLFRLLHRVEASERQSLIICLAIATAAELFLSLCWGLYTYRLANVPAFVPPGHVLMYLLGAALSRRMPLALAHTIVIGITLYAIGATAAGRDTLSIPLLALLVVPYLTLPRERRLLASTFVLTMGLEFYGTGLGVWRWSHDVPFTSMVTTNPPGVSGALYSTLDALVAVSTAALARRREALVLLHPR